MNNLLELIRSTISELQTNDLITVDNAVVKEPATPDLIDTFEMMTGLRLPKYIKDFYLAANGVECTWRIRQDIATSELEKIKDEGEQADYDYSKPLGAVKILPVQDMMMDTYWKPPFQEGEGSNEAFEFHDRQYTYGAFAKKLKIFDAYDQANNDVECAALVTDDPGKDYYLLILDNYFADWHNSRLVEFEAYIKAICETRFTIPSRRRLFGKYRGDKDQILTYNDLDKESLVPALFK
jgi:hypothetical protein